MADNSTTPASGLPVASDDIGSVQYQRVKLSLGADGTAVDAGAGAGAVGTDTQRVTLGSNDPAVIALQIMDDWDNGASDGASVSGDVAHDTADAGEPVKIGGKAITAWPTAVANADRANAITDKFGRQVVVGVPRDLRGKQKTQITSSTSETTIVTAGAAGVFNDLYKLLITNTSATATNVTIRDATGGSAVEVFAVPAGQTVGFSLPSCDAIPQAAAANNWTAQSSVSVASLEITALYAAMKDA